MNTVPVITPNSITGLKGLEERPVFFLKLNGAQSNNLVVKCERARHDDDDAKVSIPWGSKLMKNVQHALVNMKLLTAAEMQEFQAAAQRLLAAGSTQLEFALDTTLGTWVKIPYVDHLSDGDYRTEATEWNAQTKKMVFSYKVSTVALKETIRRLADRQAWADLGKVVAVDIFNGNNDRFDSAGQWVNKGNIMFLGAGQTKVIGLDTYDPNSQVRNLNQPGVFPELRILVDAHQRHEFAMKCCRSVGTTMQFNLTPAKQDHSAPTTITIRFLNGPGDIPFDYQIEVAKMHELFDSCVPDFEQGLTQGANALKDYLQRKMKDYGYIPNRPGRPSTPLPGAVPARPNLGPGQTPARPPTATPQHKTIPPGILDRMAYLGWTI